MKKKVGSLAELPNKLIAFEYDNLWLQNGFPISPFSLPLIKKIFIPKIDPFNGLFGVFSDSLPDGWGKLLVDRMLKSKKINPVEINSLNRLAIVAENGMGSLSYKPRQEFSSTIEEKDLDKLALACKDMLNTNFSENLDKLFQLGGSSGGAEPKILTKINNEEWIIKFPSSLDRKNNRKT